MSASQSQATQASGRSRGGLSAKVRIVIDSLGTPLAFALTLDQKHDCPQAEPLLEQAAHVIGPDEAEQIEAVLANKGCD